MITTMNIISRHDAANAGQVHYFTGKPCIRGHVGARFVSTGNCIECAKGHARLLKEKRIVAMRPDRDEFVMVRVHPEDLEALLVSLDWLNAQRGRPPAPRPQRGAALSIAAAPVAPDTRTEFEQLLDLHAARFNMATIRRLAAQSTPPIPETYSAGRRAPDHVQGGEMARKLAAGLEDEGYLPGEQKAT